MVVDTSAVVAAIAGEPDGPRFQDAILAAPSIAISAAVVLETRIVLQSRHGVEAVRAFDDMIDQAGIAVVPLDAEQAGIAFGAFRRYGKGQGHPAQLNILDCMSYALAMARKEPLLFKGDDFSRTDVIPALPVA